MSKAHVTENRAFLIIIHRGKVFLLRKIKDGNYTLPGGHIDYGETPRQAVVRETQEEAKRTFFSWFIRLHSKCKIDGEMYFFFYINIWFVGNLGIGENAVFDDAGFFEISNLPENLDKKTRTILKKFSKSHKKTSP